MREYTIEEVREEIRKRVLKISADFLKNLDQNLPMELNKVTAHILGFEVDSFRNEWKVSSQGEISGYISEKAKRIAKECIERLLTAELIKETFEDERKRDQIIQEFRYKFKYAFEERLREIAETLGKEMANKAAREILGDEIKATLSAEKMANPKVSLDPLHAQVLFEKLTGLFKQEEKIAAERRAASTTSSTSDDEKKDDGSTTASDGGTTSGTATSDEIDIPEESVPF